MTRALLAVLALALAGCGTSPAPEQRSVEEHGRALFEGPAAAAPSVHKLACATCHAADAASVGARILPGALLAGATERPTFWGGVESELLRAVNHCRFYFMDAQTPWSVDDEDAKATYAYLASLPVVDPAARAPQPFTIVPVAKDLPPGDAAAGKSIFEQSCASCHGAVHTGAGRRSTKIPALPDESLAAFAKYGFTPTETRVSFIEKVRHGGFLGLFGNMPPYSREVMSDEQLAALVAYLGLYR